MIVAFSVCEEFSEQTIHLFQRLALGLGIPDGHYLGEKISTGNQGKRVVLTTIAAALIAKKMKYVLEPIFWMPTGKN